MGDQELNVIFSRNLNYWLQQREKTQADLYKYMHVSSAIVSDWCTAKKRPKLENIIIIARWLMIEISDLLEEKDRKLSERERKISNLVYKVKTDEEYGDLMIDIYEMDELKYESLKSYVKFLKSGD